MKSLVKKLCLAAAVVATLGVTLAECQAQPGYYTYDIYGGRFNGVKMRPTLLSAAANSPPGYASPANVAFQAPAMSYAAANVCNPCTVARPVCDPCATTVMRPVQPTVAMSPVTAYRWGFTRTQYRPVTTADPCGNPTVAMQEYRTLLPRFTRIPVTTYRPTMVAAAAPVCNMCPTSFSSPIMQSSFNAPASDCGTCSTGGSTFAPGTGALPVPSLRPNYEYHNSNNGSYNNGGYVNGDYSNGATSSQRVIVEQPLSNGYLNNDPQPSRIETQRAPVERSFNDIEQQESRLKALPPASTGDDSGNLHETRVPRLFDPNDKSAAYRPTNRYEVAPAAYNSQPVRHEPSGSRPLDDSGWVSER